MFVQTRAVRPPETVTSMSAKPAKRVSVPREIARGLRRRLYVWRASAWPCVAVFGCPRGGSTMLADVFRSQPGTWMIDEPFALFQKRERMRAVAGCYFATPPGSQFFDLDEATLEGVDKYVRALLSPRPGVGGTSRPRSGFVIDRRAMKILNAGPLLERLHANHGIEPVIIIRHPGGQAASIVRQGWKTPLDIYCDRPAYWEGLLGARAVELAREELASGDAWRIAVVTWVFQAAPLLHAAETRPDRMYFYERAVVDPEGTVDRLARTGLIEDRAGALTALARPSGSSRLVSHERMAAIKAGDVESVVGSWRKHATDEQLAAGQEILNSLGVTAYRFDEVMPVAGADQRGAT